MKEWLDSYNVNNYLLYPLAAVELGAIKEALENNENLLRGCVVSFVYAKAKEKNIELTRQKWSYIRGRTYRRREIMLDFSNFNELVGKYSEWIGRI